MEQYLDTNMALTVAASSEGNLRPRARAPIHLTPNARVVLEKRYLRRGPDGKPMETPEEMFDRVARTVAEPDARYGADAHATREQFYDLLTSLRFFPNSPTFTGAGTPLGQLSACFVLPITDDMGRDSRGIFSTLRAAALIQQTGGGNGFSFSRLRPRGDRVQSSAGVASGPVGFLRVYDTAFGEVAQGGTRRGANMAVLRVDHPDIFEFIRCKTVEGHISNFNISVGVTDEFFFRCLEGEEHAGQICFELADGTQVYCNPNEIINLDGKEMTAHEAQEACRATTGSR